jgi:hypothetical protein
MFLVFIPIHHLAEKLDAHRGRDDRNLTIRISPFLYWFAQLLQSTFLRCMFIKVNNIGILMIFLVVNLAQDFFRFPFRMSNWWIQTFGSTQGAVGEFSSETRHHRVVLAEQFFWSSLAQRVSLTSFAIIFFTLREFWNSNFFLFSSSSVDAAQYSVSLLVQLGFEWSTTIIVFTSIWWRYGIDAMGCGSAQLIGSGYAIKFAIVFAVHALQDAVLAFDRFIF